MIEKMMAMLGFTPETMTRMTGEVKRVVEHFAAELREVKTELREVKTTQAEILQLLRQAEAKREEAWRLLQPVEETEPTKDAA